MAARSLQTLVLLLACAAPLALASECGVGSPTKASCATLYPWGTLCCSQYGWCGETPGHCDANCQRGTFGPFPLNLDSWSCSWFALL
jgi:hypothetical protein